MEDREEINHAIPQKNNPTSATTIPMKSKSDDDESVTHIFNEKTQKIWCGCGEANHSYSAYFPTSTSHAKRGNPLTLVSLPYKNWEADSKENVGIGTLQLDKREGLLLSTEWRLNACHVSATTYLLRTEVAARKLNIGGMDYQQRLQESVFVSRFLEGDAALQVVHAPLQ